MSTILTQNIQKEIENLANIYGANWLQARQQFQEKVLLIADMMKQSTTNEFEMSFISTYINKHLKDIGAHTEVIYETNRILTEFRPECLSKPFTNNIERFEETPKIPFKQHQDIQDDMKIRSEAYADKLKSLKTIDPSTLTQSDITTIYRRINNIKSSFENKCKDNNIILQKDDKDVAAKLANLFDYKVKYPKHLGVKEYTIWVEAARLMGSSWMKLADKVEEEGIRLKPGDPPLIDEKEMIESAKEMLVHAWLVDFLIDSKYKLDPLQWAKVHCTNQEWFTHYASAMSKVESVLGEIRNITRERIQATSKEYPKMFEWAVLTQASLKTTFKVMYEGFFKKIMQPRRAQHSVDLHEKLSHSS